MRSMARVIQVRNVPDRVYRTLKSRAAMSGVSLSQYVLKEIARASEAPTMPELLKRIARRAAVQSKQSPAVSVHAKRRS